MHELAVTQSMLDLVLEEAKKAGASRVQKINIVLGNLSGIVGDSVEFYFQFLSKDTIAEGASLSFDTRPTQARCRGCGHLFPLQESQWVCPRCADSALEIAAGNELYVDSIEVE
ncbi:MAG: hydrogenase maturation nickel metallochaperone HypA [Chloroflexi bacterium]|nr:MAG: hydrogenase maturation nickel metallochaperone HypA [Chloroflexota bacterium]RLC97071.1 MAG: hydrogenase maturation nickel metallochaperone HypA [Chloroflexota bacterium]